MIGEILAQRYELISAISDGVVFSVWSARDRTANRDVCIRLVKPNFEADTEFALALSEAVDQIRRIPSPHIEPIQRVVRDGSRLFLVGEATKGPTLQDRIRLLAPFSIQVATGYAAAVCRALEPLHRQNIPHGDLSSHNLIVLANGDVRVQMTGLWQAYSANRDIAMAVLPQMAPYVAPETSAQNQLSPRTDVYAIGVLYYELLTGRQPYEAPDAFQLLAAHRTEPTPDVRHLNGSIPEAIAGILLTALAKHPQDRYENATAMYQDLRYVQEALRFGRALTWPLRPDDVRQTRAVKAAATPEPKRKSEPPAPVENKRSGSRDRKATRAETGAVAPSMPAVEEDEARDRRLRKRRTERDVPVWMIVLATFFFAVLCTFVGFWTFDNLRRPRTVPVPNVQNLSLTEARAILARLKLDLRVRDREVNDRVEADRIVSVDPEPGRQVREGGYVNVVVSIGSSRVQVPVLKNETIDRAQTILENLSLRIDPIQETRASAEVEIGRVLASVPPAKTTVTRGSTIRLVLSGGSVVRPEEITKSYTYSIRVTLSDITAPKTVKLEISDIQGARTVTERVCRPNEVLQAEATGYGSSATFRIYYDGEMVKEFERSPEGMRP
jgi:serine/threonine-protein kinase